jgi:hypothetical protein
MTVKAKVKPWEHILSPPRTPTERTKGSQARLPPGLF